MNCNLNNTTQLVKEQLYNKCGLQLSNFLTEKESADYEACTFRLDQFQVVSRTAKITPTKIGQFVTLWKRIGQGPIQPFDTTDNFDICVINTLSDLGVGQFIFPKEVLLKHGILSSLTKEGKRGFRVYPPWDTPASKQAQKTQNWQLVYFLQIEPTALIDFQRVKLLYSNG